MQGASLQSYDFTITAGQTMPLLASGNYFLIKSSTGALDVRGEFGQAKAMIAGQGLSGRDFTRLELKNNSGATITGLILIEDGAENGNGFFDLNLILTGSLIVRPEVFTGVNFPVTATGATQIIAPASNTNGIYIQRLFCATWRAGVNVDAFLAKSSAPANISDGQLIGVSDIKCVSSSCTNSADIKDILVPAGLGVYYYVNAGFANAGVGGILFKTL